MSTHHQYAELQPTPLRQPSARNQVLHGDCIQLMQDLDSNSVDFILTDPPYITHYRDRSGRTIANDNQTDWLCPAFTEMHRVLKSSAFCVSFYGWNKVDLFMAAWRAAGFRPVGHIVFRKRYASKTGFMQAQHEAAYLLAKGEVQYPAERIPDVLDWRYTGNRLHPTQKPVETLKPLITAFCPAGGLVLDPFCGSGSTLVAARDTGRDYFGIELDASHHATATGRMATTERGRP